MSRFPWLARLLAAALTLSASPAHADRLADLLAVEYARPVAPRIDRERLPEDRSIVSVTLAPDGRAVAFIRVNGEQRSLWLQPTAPGAAARRILPRIGRDGTEWSRDSRWLFLVGDDELRMLSVAGEPGSGVVARLGGVSDMTLVGFDPWRPAALLVDKEDGRWRLWRTGAGGARTLLAYSSRQIVDVAIGGDGRPAFVKLVEGDHHAILARTARGGFRHIADCVRMERCDLLAVTPDERGVFMASDMISDTRGLVRLDADGGRSLLHRDPAGQVDVESVVLDRLSGEPEIAQYRGGEARNYGLTAAARDGLARLPRSAIQTIETSLGPWLIRREDSRLQGSQWMLFDPRNGREWLFLDDQPRRLTPDRLARTVAFDYAASDGMMIHGLLAVPPGRDLARAPIVTLVHGGPWNHDQIEYSSLVQLLTNRGMIVFQPQFRGSTGFGRRYLFAARGDFGDGRVQHDIEDGTRYLLARGIGDARRSAIMGASFGGYSTLQALSDGSALYRAGIAIVPPTDLGWTIQRAAARTDLGATQGIAFAKTLKWLEVDPATPGVMQRLQSQSPRAHIAAMGTPLLLIAAGRDERVPIRSVVDYAARLKARSAPATIVVGTKLAHSNVDRLGLQASLFLIEKMLHDQWGGPPVAHPSRPVKSWMTDNLKTL